MLFWGGGRDFKGEGGPVCGCYCISFREPANFIRIELLYRADVGQLGLLLLFLLCLHLSLHHIIIESGGRVTLESLRVQKSCNI